MAYNNNVPQANERPGSSQDKLLQNSIAVKAFVNRNHVDLSNPSVNLDEGKHKFIQMPEQSAAPATSASEGAIYTKESALSAVTELFFRRELNGTEIEFTSSLKAANGWTRLPSGILLKWGTGSGSGIVTTNFPVAGTIPVFTAVYNGLVCVEDNSASPNTFATLRTITTASVSVFCSSRTATTAMAATFRYLVIGA